YKFFQILSILFLFSNIYAQQIAPDFTLRDVWGVDRNLYQTLDSGKTVVLDFFITNCGTCQINTPKLDSIWHALGHNGDSLWVWGIECSERNDSTILAFMQQYHGTYPFFSTLNNNSVINDYNITYTPQYFVVCPNKNMKQVNVNNITSAIQGCNILSYEMPTNNITIKQNKQIILPSNTYCWELYSLQGKLIEKSYSNNSTISFDYLKNGFYIFKCYNHEKNYSFKLCVF
ncbi:MAG: redoxin family protein, partial [Bacteroidales bacterium]